MREFLVTKARSLLESKGFVVTGFVAGHSCFDLAARRGNLAILLKVFDNVDALREEHALELRKMGQLFNAVAIVLGSKTKAFSLKRGVIYERYGLPTLSIDSFHDLLEEKLPGIKSFKGKEIVELDSEKLQEMRKKLGLTLEELASRIGSTTESVHRYEKGRAASLQAAEKLEKVLKTRLIEEIDLFKEMHAEMENVFDDYIEDRALEKVHDLGLKLALFKHAPFKAGSHPAESIIISKGSTRQEVKKRAGELHRTVAAFKAHGMVISSKPAPKAVEHVPIVEEEELTTMSKFKELMKLLKEREKAEKE